MSKALPNKDLLLSTFNKTIRSAWNLDNKIHEVALNEWLSNFSGRALRSQFATTEDAIDRERNLALFLLCHFVYYNENEIKYLTKLMFEKYMHKHFESNNVINVDQSKIKEALDVTVFEKLGYVSESSSFLMYLFRQVNKLSKKHFDSRCCDLSGLT